MLAIAILVCSLVRWLLLGWDSKAAGETESAAAGEPPTRFALTDIEAAQSRHQELLIRALQQRSYAVITLPASSKADVQSSLKAIGAALERFYGCSPRYHECAGSLVSGWSRRVFMHYAREGGSAATIEGVRWPGALAGAMAAAAHVDPLLARVGYAITSTLRHSFEELAAETYAFTTGQFDAFFYPDDGEGDADEKHEDEKERREAGSEETYDASCPCPSHFDPGVITLVCETESGLEAQLPRAPDGIWERLSLAPGEICVVAGKTLETATKGRVPACRHRVARTAAPRASIVFEIHHDRDDPGAASTHKQIIGTAPAALPELPADEREVGRRPRWRRLGLLRKVITTGTRRRGHSHLDR